MAGFGNKKFGSHPWSTSEQNEAQAQAPSPPDYGEQIDRETFDDYIIYSIQNSVSEFSGSIGVTQAPFRLSIPGPLSLKTLNSKPYTSIPSKNSASPVTGTQYPF